MRWGQLPQNHPSNLAQLETRDPNKNEGERHKVSRNQAKPRALTRLVLGAKRAKLVSSLSDRPITWDIGRPQTGPASWGGPLE